MISELLIKMGLLSSKVTHKSPLLNYIGKSAPFIFSTQKIWHNHLTDSCEKSVNCFNELQKQALINLDSWNKYRDEDYLIDSSVQVSKDDSFSSAAKIAKQCGVAPVVLIMASAHYPAGYALPEMAYKDGLAAQEEVSFNVSTLSREIDEQLKLPKDAAELYYDAKTSDFIYHTSMSERIKAMRTMSDAEQAIVRLVSADDNNDPLYIVPMTDRQDPHVCFKSPLFLVDSDYLDSPGSSTKQTVADLSYRPLPQSEIFPFHAMFSAAVEPNDMPGGIYDWDDDAFVKAYIAEMRRRIRAQLDTLILHGHRHAVLSAFGCGAFGGKADIVANIYLEEIQDRSHCFDHLVFSIASQGERKNNYQAFFDVLDGLNLGSKNIITNSSKLSV